MAESILFKPRHYLKCLLMPSVKIGVDSFIKVCDADEFNMIINE